MTMTGWCPFNAYSTIFGLPGKGIHSFRFLNTAIVDYLLTFVLACITTYLTVIPLVLSTIGIGFAIFGFFLNNMFPLWLVLDPRHTIPEIMLFISSVAVTSFSIKNIYYSISLNKEEPVDKSKESNIIIITVIIIHLGLIMLFYLIILIGNTFSVSPQPPPLL